MVYYSKGMDVWHISVSSQINNAIPSNEISQLPIRLILRYPTK